MEWLFDNLKLVIFVIVIVVYAFKAMRNKAEGEGTGDQGRPTRRTLDGEEDAAEADRTRQIQEEIRRRILARQRGEDPAGGGAPQPPVIVVESAPPPLPVPTRPPPVPVEAPDPYAAEEHRSAQTQEAAHETAVLDAQRALEEQLRQVRLMREQAMAGVPRLAPAVAAATTSSRRAGSVRRALREDLAGRGALRRAIVLREVLGEPVAMRTGPAGMTRR